MFSEQISKLQAKQHQDTELLEEIRSFSKHRAALEKDYGQALQRLAVQYQKRDWQRGNTDAITSGSVFGIWRSIVDTTAQTATSRLSAAEEYRKLTLQASKSLRNAKDIHAKKGLEQLQKVQGEVVDALRELHRIKKSYHQLSHIANVAREKAADAQARSTVGMCWNSYEININTQIFRNNHKRLICLWTETMDRHATSHTL